VDWVFKLPLWLTTMCRGHTLWAFKEEHIATLEGYIAAEHRQRQPDQWGWSNRSMLSRLPRWMIEAQAREDVLAGLGRLRAML
jgi:hypothetical protein